MVDFWRFGSCAHAFEYCISLNNLIFFMSQVQCLFEGSAYLKGSYHKNKTFWLYNLIYFMAYRLKSNLRFGFYNSLVNTVLQVFNNTWKENWMKEDQDILTLNWKTSLLMKINSHCWLRTSLQWLQYIFIILWKYLYNRRTAAAALIQGRHLLTFPPHVWRLIVGSTFCEVVLIHLNMINDVIFSNIPHRLKLQ